MKQQSSHAESAPRTPRLGAIEGFYGEPWSDEARLQMAAWLPALGLDSYLYAPKRDAHLRKSWRKRWPADALQRLSTLASRCETSGLLLGIGLSPFALYQNYGHGERSALKERVTQLNDIGAPLLALLFDDMPGDCDRLAARQGEIAGDVRQWSSAKDLLVCPTYYSDDPVLDRVFGSRPHDYLREFAAALPAGSGIFWTGPRVCSDTITPADLPDLGDAQATLALWDNYPVNDSKLRSEHIYLEPFTGRAAKLGSELSWHFSNAMNQPALSLPALRSLARLYGSGGDSGAAAALADAGIDAPLLEACAPLGEYDFASLTPAQQERLREQAKRPSTAGLELSKFLAGGYRFDPQCLTD